MKAIVVLCIQLYVFVGHCRPLYAIAGSSGSFTVGCRPTFCKLLLDFVSC